MNILSSVNKHYRKVDLDGLHSLFMMTTINVTYFASASNTKEKQLLENRFHFGDLAWYPGQDKVEYTFPK
jgi:hypothetical protein